MTTKKTVSKNSQSETGKSKAIRSLAFFFFQLNKAAALYLDKGRFLGMGKLARSLKKSLVKLLEK